MNEVVLQVNNFPTNFHDSSRISLGATSFAGNNKLQLTFKDDDFDSQRKYFYFKKLNNL
jgi:hypothetical protein